MLLIKCSCGCHFSVKPDSFKRISKKLSCQNCNKSMSFSFEHDLEYLVDEFATNGFEVTTVPDDTKINLNVTL